MQAKTLKSFPENSENKEKFVKNMFDNIAERYDFLNHLLSFRMDIRWRKKVIRLLKKRQPQSVLDLATGTADLAIMAAEEIKNSKVTGLDISINMIEKGRMKVKKKNLENRVELIEGNGQDIPFESDSYDAIMIAFGIRNYAQPLKGLKEMYRTLKPGGMLTVLEFSIPRHFPFKQIYMLYFRYFLPVTGRFISGNEKAYSYLPESVTAFPQGKEFISLMEKAGFKQHSHRSLAGGIASIYTSLK